MLTGCKINYDLIWVQSLEQHMAVITLAANPGAGCTVLPTNFFYLKVTCKTFVPFTQDQFIKKCSLNLAFTVEFELKLNSQTCQCNSRLFLG